MNTYKLDKTYTDLVERNKTNQPGDTPLFGMTPMYTTTQHEKTT